MLKHIITRFRRSYGLKLSIGCVATAVFITVVGLSTNDAGSTVIAGIAGLLTLGSINAAETVATLRENTRQIQQVAAGEVETEITTKRDDEFGVLVETIDQMRASLAAQIEQVESTRADAETARSEAEQAKERAQAAEVEAREQTEQYEAVAESYARTMAAAADGDLTQRLDVSHEQPAPETIGESFNDMMDDLQQTLGTGADVARISKPTPRRCNR